MKQADWVDSFLCDGENFAAEWTPLGRKRIEAIYSLLLDPNRPAAFTMQYSAIGGESLNLILPELFNDGFGIEDIEFLKCIVSGLHGTLD